MMHLAAEGYTKIVTHMSHSDPKLQKYPYAIASSLNMYRHKQYINDILTKNWVQSL